MDYPYPLNDDAGTQVAEEAHYCPFPVAAGRGWKPRRPLAARGLTVFQANSVHSRWGKRLACIRLSLAVADVQHRNSRFNSALASHEDCVGNCRPTRVPWHDSRVGHMGMGANSRYRDGFSWLDGDDPRHPVHDPRRLRANGTDVLQ
jgi:hypothetical protein